MRDDGLRPFNFSGGPGALPKSVLLEASRAVQSFEDTGDSILGLSHRSARFLEIVRDAEARVLSLVGAPKGYRVLFLQGGGSLQFSMVPMHLLRGAQLADYIVSGYWSAKAAREAQHEGRVRVLWSGESSGWKRLPEPAEITPSPDAAYLHYVSNETVEGLQFPFIPGHEALTRVCDMSSDFLSQPVDVERFDLVYAHAQKNLGPAGVTLVLVRDWILERGGDLPAMLRYRSHAEADSIFNTPPVFAIYVTWLVLRWLEDSVGGLENMAAYNRRKANKLYALLDRHPDVFETHAARGSRSLMNVTLRLRRRAEEAALIGSAERAGFLGVGGHRSLGGLRVSLYNAVTEASVDSLCDFLDDYARARPK